MSRLVMLSEVLLMRWDWLGAADTTRKYHVLSRAAALDGRPGVLRSCNMRVET